MISNEMWTELNEKARQHSGEFAHSWLSGAMRVHLSDAEAAIISRTLDNVMAAEAEAKAEAEEAEYEDGLSDVEADAMTLASAGWGTDEDYGYFGGEDW
jgi:hypothetical protein